VIYIFFDNLAHRFSKKKKPARKPEPGAESGEAAPA
jgi:hypothetical protein